MRKGDLGLKVSVGVLCDLILARERLVAKHLLYVFENETSVIIIIVIGYHFTLNLCEKLLILGEWTLEKLGDVIEVLVYENLELLVLTEATIEQVFVAALRDLKK